jgi:hypothetical protein
MSVSRRFTGGPAPILVRQYLRHRYEKWRLFVPISGDGLGPDLPKVILNEQCHFFPAPLRGCFFCAGLSWRLYIIGMGPRVMPLIFESGYQKLAIYTIGDRTKHSSPARTDAGPANWAANSTFHTCCLDWKARSMEMWFLRRRTERPEPV